MTAFGYVRKSVFRDGSTSHSPEVQEEKIRALAAVRGDTDIEVLRDLDVSGGKAAADRPGFAQIAEAIESGDAHAVYAYDLSRLFRNLKEQIAFFETTTARDIPVYLVEGTVTEVKGATGELMLNVLGSMNQWQRKNTSEKIRATIERKRANGDKLGGRYYGDGSRPGEDADAVIRAFQETGNYTAAARRLNEEKLPTRNAKGGIWFAASVKSIVKRLKPELIIPGTGPGTAAGFAERPARFARLLRCSIDGSMLSPSYDKGLSLMRYYCHVGSVLPHGRKTVPEHKLTPTFAREMEHARLIVEKIRRGDPKDVEKRLRLEDRRARLSRQHEMGLIDDAQVADRMASIKAEEATLSVRRTIGRLRIDLLATQVNDDPRRVNEYLRRLLDHVVVDMSGVEGRGGEPRLQFAWRDPEMRASDEAVSAED